MLTRPSKAIIAAVHGYAPDSISSIKEVDIAIAANVEVLHRTQKLVGNSSLTLELVLTTRNFTGAEANEYGFVSRTSPTSNPSLYKAAFHFADQIAPKRLVNSGDPPKFDDFESR